MTSVANFWWIWWSKTSDDFFLSFCYRPSRVFFCIHQLLCPSIVGKVDLRESSITQKIIRNRNPTGKVFRNWHLLIKNIYSKNYLLRTTTGDQQTHGRQSAKVSRCVNRRQLKAAWNNTRLILLTLHSISGYLLVLLILVMDGSLNQYFGKKPFPYTLRNHADMGE